MEPLPGKLSVPKYVNGSSVLPVLCSFYVTVVWGWFQPPQYMRNFEQPEPHRKETGSWKTFPLKSISRTGGYSNADNIKAALNSWRAIRCTREGQCIGSKNSRRHEGWASEGEKFQHKVGESFPTRRTVQQGAGPLCEASGSPSLEASMERMSTSCPGASGGDSSQDVGLCPVPYQIPFQLEEFVILVQQTGIRKLPCKRHWISALKTKNKQSMILAFKLPTNG